MEEIFRSLYARYASGLSADDIEQKVRYALTMDPSDAINQFYQKYTGDSPKKEDYDYVNNLLSEQRKAFEQQQREEDRVLAEEQETQRRKDKATSRGIGLATELIRDPFITLGLLATGQKEKVIERGETISKFAMSPVKTTAEMAKGLVDFPKSVLDAPLIEVLKARGFDQKQATEILDNTSFVMPFQNESDFLSVASKELEGLQKAGREDAKWNETIGENLLAGEFGTALTQTVEGVLGAVPSVAVSSMPGGLFLLGASEAGNSYQELAELKPEKRGAVMLGNAIMQGTVEAISEQVTRGIAKRALGIGGAGEYGEAASKFFTREFFKRLGTDALFEGISEVGAQEINFAFDQSIGLNRFYDKDGNFDGMAMLKRSFDTFVISSLVGGGMTTLGQARNRQRNLMIEGFTPGNIRKENQKLAQRIQELQGEYIDTRDEDALNEIKELESRIRLNKITVARTIDEMTGQERLRYAQNLSKMFDIGLRIKNEQNLKESSKESLKKRFSQNSNEAMEIFSKAEERANQKAVKENVKQIRAAAELKGMKVFELDREGMRKRLGNEAMDSDGGIQGDEIFVNMEVAPKKGAISVGSHELLHRLLRSKFTSESDRIRITNEFIDTLRSKGLYNIVQKRIDDNYRYQRDEDGKIKLDKDGNELENEFDTYSEEYFTAFSDAIVKGEIEFDTDIFDDMKTAIESLINRLTPFRKAKFKNAKQAYDFVKSYSQNIKKGGKPTVDKEEDEKTGRLLQSRTLNDMARRYDRLEPTELLDFHKQYTSAALSAIGYNIGKGDIAPQNAISFVNSEFPSVMRTYNPSESEFSTWINATIGRRGSKFYSSEFDKAGVGVGQSRRIEDLTRKEEAEISVQETTTTTKDDKPVRQIKPDSVLPTGKGTSDFVKETQNLASKLTEGDLSELNFKKLRVLAADAFGKIFNIPGSRITNPKDNLRQGDNVSEIQRWILKNADRLIKLMPKANTDIISVQSKVKGAKKLVRIGGEPTGVSRNLLNAFYTKGKRIGNNFQWSKNRINRNDFLALFGIKDNKVDPDFKMRTSEAQAIKGLLELTSRLVTNYYVRQDIDSRPDLSISNKIKIGDKIASGKSDIMYSRTVSDQKSRFKEATRLDETFQIFNGKKLAKSNPIVKDAIKTDVVPILAANLTPGQKTVLLYTMQGTGSDKLDGALGRSGMIYPDIESAREALFLDKQLEEDAKNSDEIKNALNYAGKSVLSTSNLSKNVLQDLKTNEDLQQTVVKENIAKANVLADLVSSLVAIVKKSPDLAAGINHIIGLQSSYQGHFIRKLVPFVSFTDTSLLKDGAHDEHYSKSLRTTRFVQSIIREAAKRGENYTDQELIDDLQDLVLGQARGVVSKKDGKKFNEIKGIGEQAYISEQPIEEIHSKISDPSLHFVLPNTVMNPSDVLKSLDAIKKEKDADELASKANQNTFSDILKGIENAVKQNEILSNYDKAVNYSRTSKQGEGKGISVFDFDDTLARTASKVLYTLPDGSKGKLNATQFAKESDALEAKGAKFDFSEFDKVIRGKKGPLFDLAKRRKDKFGAKDIFILTARPQSAAPAIRKFLKGMGLDIPLANITGLEDGSAQSKANWIVSKVAQGYNDFYFADDAYKNVKAVQDILNVADVKSDVQQAKYSKTKSVDRQFNDILEKNTGVEWFKEYSGARAKAIGKRKNSFHLIPPSAEDFAGLLYRMLGKGKAGDTQFMWFKEKLLDPIARTARAVDRMQVGVSADYKALKKMFPKIPKTLQEEAIEGYSYSDAVRVYIWNKQGLEVPGLSKKDSKELMNFMNSETQYRDFAEGLMKIQKGKQYPAPDSSWQGGTITSDLVDSIRKVNRKELLSDFNENVDQIFSEKNKNKLRALYGNNYVEALENSLERIRRGTNKLQSGNKNVDEILDWVNGSVGAIMFFNVRSAALQMISNVNFINWTDNNVIKAGKAFANQPQYWKDVMYLMNSPFLTKRRQGLKINVTESEIADVAKTGGMKGAISYLLKKGFLFTQIADSMAIATGGATMYRNRVSTYLKQGMEQKKAEEQAFLDFQEIAEETQQSSRTDRISMQQAGPLGRVVLAFANTPMQYNRLIKKAVLDLKNRRGDWRANVSKIVYYGAIQNVIFNGIQNALFTMAFDDDDEIPQDKAIRTANGMADSLLRGMGWGGAAVSTFKNVILRLWQEDQKARPKYEEAALELLDFSPPISSKVTKVRSALRSLEWDAEEIRSQGFSLENPAYMIGGQTLSALFNIPLDRVIRKYNNIEAALREDTEIWQKIALLGGWSEWELGVDDQKYLPYGGTGVNKGLKLKKNLNLRKLKLNTKKLKLK